MRKKIAHIQLLPMLSGAQRVTLEELKRLDKNKYELFLVCKEPGPLSFEAEKYGVKCFFVKNFRRNISPYNDIVSLFKLWYIFKKNKLDIVHTHSSKTGVLGRLAAWMSRTKMILHTVHGYAFDSVPNYIVKRVFMSLEIIGGLVSDHVIFLHDDDAKIAIDKLFLTSNKVLIIPNGTDVNLFSLREKQQPVLWGDSDSPINLTFGFIGRLWEQKNPEEFVSAALSLLKEFAKLPYTLNFVLVGDGDLKEDLIKLVKSENLTEYFHFLGWRNDTAFLLNQFDVFVLPSKWEGMPLAIIEAMSSGLPCLVSNISGNNHLISHRIEGLLHESGNVSSLKDNMKELVLDSNLRALFAKNALKSAHDNYNIDNRIKIIDDIYSGN
jgi:glycosyltransferase involved in cell wall biosynthesis